MVPHLPPPKRQRIIIQCQTHWEHSFVVRDLFGFRIDLNGCRALFQVRDRPGGIVYVEAKSDDGGVVFQRRSVENSPIGVFTVLLKPEDTAGILRSYGVYDVLLTLPDGRSLRPYWGNAIFRHPVAVYEEA